MDVSIQSFSHKLNEIFSKNWPSSISAVEFVPLYDLTLGHIGTDAPTRLARKVLQKPEALALEIKALWEQDGGPTLEPTRGFLNARLSAAELLHSNPLLDTVVPLPEKRVSVLVPACTEETERAAHLRLVLRAYLQAFCAQFYGAKVQLVLVGKGLIPLSFQPQALVNLIDSVLSWPLQTVSSLVEGVQAELQKEDHPDEMRVLWLLPATIPAPQFKALFPRGEANGHIRLSYVGAAWANWQLTQKELASLTQLAARVPAETLIYLCSEVAGTDVDLMVPQLKEKANPIQYAALTAQRLRTLLSQTSRAGADVLPNEDWLKLLLRLRYFYSFERQAGRLGQVAEFISVLTEILERTNALCNQPHFRAQLATGTCGAAEIKILTGVLDLLSDIIAGRYIAGVQKV